MSGKFVMGHSEGLQFLNELISGIQSPTKDGKSIQIKVPTNLKDGLKDFLDTFESADTEMINMTKVTDTDESETRQELCIYDRTYNIHEIFVILKQLPKYSLATVKHGMLKYCVMLDEYDDLILVEKNENEVYYENKYESSGDVDYLHEQMHDLDFLNLTFKLIEPKEENWIPVKYSQEALTKYYDDECDIRVVESVGSKFMRSTWKYKTFKYDEDINPENECIIEQLLYGQWEYLEVE